jgi:hypothetical protein
VQESDPILFAQAVTIPATMQLLERRAQIAKALPSGIEPELASDIADFGASYEVVFSPHQNPAELWATYRDDANLQAKVDTSKFFPHMVYHYGKDQGNVGVFFSVDAAALIVPMKLGSLANSSIFQIARKYTKSDLFTAPKTMRSMYSCLLNDKDSSSLEQGFEFVMTTVSRSELKLATGEQLLRAKASLEKAVETTIKARSDDIF